MTRLALAGLPSFQPHDTVRQVAVIHCIKPQNQTLDKSNAVIALSMPTLH
jgi:cytochrome c-type biogenesis protein CcmH/NrfF